MVHHLNIQNGIFMNMKNSTKEVLLFLILISISSILPYTSAQTAQWFPEDGTILEYELKTFFTLDGGIKAESTTFDVFNHTLTSQIYFVSSYWSDISTGWIDPNFTLIENDANLIIRNEYVLNTSISWLDRTTYIKTNVAEYIGSDELSFISYCYPSTYAHTPFFGDNPVSIEQGKFFSSIPDKGPIEFCDNVDNTLSPGELAFEDDYFTIGLTDEHIIIMTYDDSFSYIYNRTLIADKSGQLQSFIYTFTNLDIKLYNVDTVSYSFLKTDDEYISLLLLSLSDTSNWILFAFFGLLGLSIGALIFRRRN